jgi:hypothetical protein
MKGWKAAREGLKLKANSSSGMRDTALAAKRAEDHMAKVEATMIQAAAAQGLEAYHDRAEAAVGGELSAFLAVVREADPKLFVRLEPLARDLRASICTSLEAAAAELQEAGREAAREQVRLRSQMFEQKLDRQRAAAHSSLKNLEAQMEGELARQLEQAGAGQPGLFEQKQEALMAQLRAAEAKGLALSEKLRAHEEQQEERERREQQEREAEEEAVGTFEELQQQHSAAIEELLAERSRLASALSEAANEAERAAMAVGEGACKKLVEALAARMKAEANYALQNDRREAADEQLQRLLAEMMRLSRSQEQLEASLTALAADAAESRAALNTREAEVSQSQAEAEECLALLAQQHSETEETPARGGIGAGGGGGRLLRGIRQLITSTTSRLNERDEQLRALTIEASNLRLELRKLQDERANAKRLAAEARSSGDDGKAELEICNAILDEAMPPQLAPPIPPRQANLLQAAQDADESDDSDESALDAVGTKGGAAVKAAAEDAGVAPAHPTAQRLRQLIEMHRGAGDALRHLHKELQVATSTLDALKQSLSQAETHVKHVQERSQRERASLVQSAVLSLQHLRGHLAVALSGLRIESQPEIAPHHAKSRSSWQNWKRQWGVLPIAGNESILLRYTPPVSVQALQLSPREGRQPTPCEFSVGGGGMGLSRPFSAHAAAVRPALGSLRRVRGGCTPSRASADLMSASGSSAHRAHMTPVPPPVSTPVSPLRSPRAHPAGPRTAPAGRAMPIPMAREDDPP